MYPNDNDRVNIKPFHALIFKYKVNLDYKKLHPDNFQYLDALKLNADLLKNYGDNILKGEAWF